jgi:hypothetical protein
MTSNSDSRPNSQFTGQFQFLEVLSDNDWDIALNESRQNNVFLSSEFLKIYSNDFYRFFLTLEDEVIGGLVHNVANRGKESGSNFSTYHSLFYRDKIIALSDLTKTYSLYAIIKRLSFQEKFRLSLHPTLTDIRGVDWFKFDFPETAVSYQVKYTGELMLENFCHIDEYWDTVPKKRKQEYTKSCEINELFFGDIDDLSDFMEIYKSTFLSQGKIVTEDEVNEVTRIAVSTIRSGIGHLLGSKNRATGQLLGFVFILDYCNSVYYLFASSTKEGRVFHSNTFLLGEVIKKGIEDKKVKFDFVGLNSPKRSFYKASFNPILTPYFEIFNA